MSALQPLPGVSGLIADMLRPPSLTQSGPRDARIHRTIVTEYRRRGPGERANPTEQTMNVHALTAVQDAGVDSQPFLTNTFRHGELS
jgi:hypothetical protein